MGSGERPRDRDADLAQPVDGAGPTPDEAAGAELADLVSRRIAAVTPGRDGERLRAGHDLADLRAVLTAQLEGQRATVKCGATDLAGAFGATQARRDVDTARARTGQAPLLGDADQEAS